MPTTEPLSFLVVGTAGVEVAPFVEPDPYGVLHSAQPWAPRVCRCGQLHAPCDLAVVALLVGPPQGHVHLDPLTWGLAVFPEGRPWAAPGFSHLSVAARDFKRSAAEVVRHVVSGFAEPTLVCFEVQDLVLTLSPPRPLRFACASSEHGLAVAVAELLSEASWLSAETRAVTLAVRGSYLTLQEIGDACLVLQQRVPDASILLTSPDSPGAAMVSILGA